MLHNCLVDSYQLANHFLYEFYLIYFSWHGLVLWMCFNTWSNNKLSVTEFILFSSDKLDSPGSLIWRDTIYLFLFCKGVLFTYGFVGYLCYFDFSKLCLNMSLCLYVEDATSKFFGVGFSGMLGLGKQTWLGICHLQIYTVSLFPSLWMGKCKQVSENRLPLPCFP